MADKATCLHRGATPLQSAGRLCRTRMCANRFCGGRRARMASCRFLLEYTCRCRARGLVARGRGAPGCCARRTLRRTGQLQLSPPGRCGLGQRGALRRRRRGVFVVAIFGGTGSWSSASAVPWRAYPGLHSVGQCRVGPSGGGAVASMCEIWRYRYERSKGIPPSRDIDRLPT